MTPEFLTREQEYALAIRWRDHKAVPAMQKIVGAYRPLVIRLALRFRRFQLPMDDMVQEGMLGLVTALKRFDPDLGNRFSTFARWYVIAALQDYVLTNFSSVKGQRTKEAKARLFRGGRLPDLSLDAPISSDGGVETWADRLVDEAASPEEVAERVIDGERQHKIIKRAMRKLSPRSRKVIEARLMLDEPRTLDDLGQEYGVSKERIRQIEARALEDLRTALLGKRRRKLVAA
ncbi:sigma-70 family RNA polymerase sigma factor [Mesorhizobium sp. M0189]|uniref:sigma-70 family RNA polymerase sigma factor n=1 Tax=Mesorhizobium sp. M0189 TaxID=2956909 RepID=UPI003337FDCF